MKIAYFEGPPDLVRDKYIKDEEANEVSENPRRRNPLPQARITGE
jgi:hypothetical protein